MERIECMAVYRMIPGSVNNDFDRDRLYIFSNPIDGHRVKLKIGKLHFYS